MDALLEHLQEVIEPVRDRVRSALGEGGVLHASDDQIMRALALAAELQRVTDAVLVEATGEVARRSVQRDRELRMTSRYGCHDVSELVQRTTRLAPATVGRLQRGAKPVRVREAFNGDPLPPLLPAIRATLMDGTIGLDGLLAVAGPLDAMSDRVPLDDVRMADAVLAAEARGEGPAAAPPATADQLRVQAQVWCAALDQDGAEPREARALRLRGLTLGRTTDGVVPIRGAMLPEIAAQLQFAFDAITSPRVRDGEGSVMFRPSDEITPDDGTDGRTRAQKMHDALATVLTVAASSRLLPTIGGAAPTLVVSVRAEDLLTQNGWAHVEGADEPVSRAAAQHAGCAGVIQRVMLGHNGRIRKIGTEERIFNRHQRRAIALRDGGCIIPGCGVPAGWCEIHHVTEHSRGGPTHTDNGVLLCWYHHRHLDHHGWRIRMNHGVPEVLAPTWIEGRPTWRAATASKTRLLDRVVRRT
ncbi:MAG: HNH endonuclease [Microbacterium sp.]|uniref:HNH endonuclease signature motif containing protein n=1 Tax=unclassified Microbacterium TaxID=2609290 RepID=UPI000DB1F4DC|nr:HNH endonuclease signature motif containing protein [Microbacterium sp.]PZU38129.1 MAG: HNH endonuclease [Microbacterium sp.]